MKPSKLYIVGIGPGARDLLTPKAQAALADSSLVVGYEPYVAQIADLIPHAEVMTNRMTGEMERATFAVEQALMGQNVAIVSSGDAGIYAMGPLVFELLENRGWSHHSPLEVVLVPGITAAIACASLVGTPLGHDSCTISLSDLLTPWELIQKRIDAAASADFVISFYNPRSKHRQQHIIDAQQILLQYRTPDTPVAVVDNAYRDGQRVMLSTLADFTQLEFGMTATVIVGNSQSYIYSHRLITPRGYQQKYDLEAGQIKPGQRAGRALRTETVK